METRKRARPDDLTHFARLVRSPQSYHLFHAMRIIEAHHPEMPPLGTSRRPRNDPVRLAQEASLAFPPTTIASFEQPKAGGPMRLVNRAFGLFGPNGPLPLHLTEYARERQRNHRDGAMVAFVDMLTHRLMSLFYRAWRVSQPTVSFDRPGTDPFARKVSALAGLASPGLQARDAMPDTAKRQFAGHLGAGPKSAEALVSMLSAFFGAPVRLQQFVGTWLDLEPDDRWQLGAAAGLGRSTSIGDRVWTRSAKFRLRVGPLSLAEYQRLLPGEGALERLDAVVRNHVGDALDWDVNLVLRADDVPRAALGTTAALGLTTWIGVRRDQMNRDADDLYLSPPSTLHKARVATAAASGARSIHSEQKTLKEIST